MKVRLSRVVAGASAPVATTRLAVVVAACCAALSVGVSPAAASGSGAPFTDPNSHGYIGLCDLAGNNVTSGSVSSAPFVWQAVSSMSVPTGYGGRGQNTALTIYQPRKGVDPADWNGDQLTAASYYKKASPPAAAATYKDISLATIIKEFPPSWDGLYQLRMAFARKGYGNYNSTYPSTVIQVTGSTWHVVQGGTVSCHRVHTASNETFAGISVLNPHPSRNETPTSAPTSQRATTSAGTGRSTGSSGSAHVISADLAGEASPSGSQASDALSLVIAGLALILLGVIGGGLIWRRRDNGAETS